MGTSEHVHKPLPSSNWLALHKSLAQAPSSSSKHSSTSTNPRKRRKVDHSPPHTALPDVPIAHPEASTHPSTSTTPSRDDIKNGESLPHLRAMVKAEIEHPPAHTQPGKYLAVDCEMVGVGIDGAESVLARVSLVNFHGAVLLDLFVRPRERVVDYRTQFSGIRPSDIVHAKPFEEAQKEVSDLLRDRILVGHAVHNDLKALLLSHPRALTRDTQLLFFKHKLVRGRRPALRNLVQQELGLTIQSGEHSSVTDARATMALFRLHRKTFEKDLRTPLPARARTRSLSPSAPASASTPVPTTPAKRARASSVSSRASNASDDESAPTSAPAPATNTKRKRAESFPGGGRRGVSSGLSTVVTRPARAASGKGSKSKSKSKGKPEAKAKEEWWKDLGGGGAKGGFRLGAR
ncbi:ribonuclease H-like domain-containing protein [Lenzites betulinus]|nr:ribonuclease H-like domain-containing protein [Lenzites betulinus]